MFLVWWQGSCLWTLYTPLLHAVSFSIPRVSDPRKSLTWCIFINNALPHIFPINILYILTYKGFEEKDVTDKNGERRIMKKVFFKRVNLFNSDLLNLAKNIFVVFQSNFEANRSRSSWVYDRTNKQRLQLYI